MATEELGTQRAGRGRLIVWLVGTACLAVLGMLMIVGVRQARDAARRISSGNNLKQLGLAFHNHHDALGHLPPGTLGSADVRGDKEGVLAKAREGVKID